MKNGKREQRRRNGGDRQRVGMAGLFVDIGEVHGGVFRSVLLCLFCLFGDMGHWRIWGGGNMGRQFWKVGSKYSSGRGG